MTSFKQFYKVFTESANSNLKCWGTFVGLKLVFKKVCQRCKGNSTMSEQKYIFSQMASGRPNSCQSPDFIKSNRSNKKSGEAL